MSSLNLTCNINISYGGAKINVLQNIEKIQSKDLRIINFQNPWA